MNKKIWYIYVHKSKTTGKCYVGQTCRKLETRWGMNGCHYTKTNNLKFYNAIQKYGWRDFEHYIITTCSSLKEAYKLEQYYIEQLDSFKNGYNSTLGGSGSLGRKMSEATKQKLAIANKGKESWIKYIPKERMPMYGKHHSEETKRKIGNANRGRIISKESREKMRLAKLGKRGARRTKETKEKLRLKKIGKQNPMYGTHTNNRPESKIPVIQYDLNGNVVNEFESLQEAFRSTHIRHIGESMKRNGTAGGFKWKKKNSN